MAFDVVVYGATPAGVAAAVSAAREGARTALFQEDRHIGGLASGGLSNTDFKSFEALSGVFREFMQRVRAYYVETHGDGSQQAIECVQGGYYEPRVARLVFERMLEESGVTVFLDAPLAGVSIRTDGPRKRIGRANLGGKPIEARVFIDATYEGDLLAAASVPYELGCEDKARYGESLAFDKPNRWVQTYNFRVCLTSDPENRIPIKKPERYDRERFAGILDLIDQGELGGLTQETDPGGYVLKFRPIPNRKADWNDNARTPISLSIPNVNHPWPEGSAEVRRGIFETYKDHSLGLFWFLANDPDVPQSWRSEMSEWGLPRDEYPDTGHWSPALYVREGRRMLGRYVFTQHDVAQAEGDVRTKLQPDSVAIGDYPLNCHGVWSPGPGEPRVGHLGQRVEPFQVPYGVMLPDGMDGFLAPVPMSASHVGYAALRMEPVWTALGQAAGVAAGMAVAGGSEPGDVNVGALQRRLHELGALTVYASDLGTETAIPRPGWDKTGGEFRAWLHTVPPQSKLFRATQWFGTKGFFHGLQGRDVEPEPGLVGRSTGQWGLRRPGHAIEADKPLDEILVARWDGLAKDLGMNPAGVFEAGMTRGEYLLGLWEKA